MKNIQHLCNKEVIHLSVVLEAESAVGSNAIEQEKNSPRYSIIEKKGKHGAVTREETYMKLRERIFYYRSYAAH